MLASTTPTRTDRSRRSSGRAQLTVSDNEMATFIRDYPLIRQAADALYLPEIDPDEPAIKFDPLDFYPAPSPRRRKDA